MLFCIGDIHGHFEKLMRLMKICHSYAEAAGAKNPSFILLGDYVDRGPESRKVIEFLATRPPNVRGICGNHEDMMINALHGGDDLARWLANGGGETLQSYGARQISEVPAAHLELMASLPTFIDDGLRLFVHAGIDPADPHARDRHTLLWTRQHPPEDQDIGRLLVHGHTPVRSGRPELLANRLNLDTGAGWGRRLSAAAFADGRVMPLAFLDELGAITTQVQPDAR